MAEKPILFSGPMVQAILDGRKSQTRRVIKPQPDHLHIFEDRIPHAMLYRGKDVDDLEIMPPYAVSDTLWVRETWTAVEDVSGSEKGGNYCWWYLRYEADKTIQNWPQDRLGKLLHAHLLPDCDTLGEEPSYHEEITRPSIFMPRWASRISLRVTGVRAERVQEISEEDALAEGVRQLTKDGNLFKYAVYDKGDMSSVAWADMPHSPIDAYRNLWDSLNAKRGYGWGVNPYAWVIEFERMP